MLDGVFVPGAEGAAPVFHPLAVREEDVLSVVRATELGVLKLLERRGLIDPEECAPSEEDEFAEQRPLLAGLYQASVRLVAIDSNSGGSMASPSAIQLKSAVRPPVFRASAVDHDQRV